MDKKYIELFTELAHATEVSAEQVMEYDKSKDDTRGYETAQLMRDDYSKLYDKLRAEDFNGELTKEEFARILVGCHIVVGQLQDRITALKRAITGYQTDLIPKLDKIVQAEPEDAMKIANEEFIVKAE